MNAIFYLLRTGCQWDYLPKCFPPKSTVFDYFSQWRDDGVLDDMVQILREEIRTAAGRNPRPSAGIIDSQTVKTAGPAMDVGYDGGKRIKGRKRHIVVDVLGLLLTVMVHSAGIQDRAGARLVVAQLMFFFGTIKIIWADGGYTGSKLIDWALSLFNIVWTVVNTLIEATADQSLFSWIQSHVRAFGFFAGVPVCLVPDNLKSGVTKSHLYDPVVNRTYQELANHYGVAVVPARVRASKDKSKVEVGVQGIQRWILAPLRDVTFFGVHEINEAIKPLLQAYNQRAFYELEGTRRSHYLETDKPALKPLPMRPYTYAEWKKARSGADYHVAIDRHYYRFCRKNIFRPRTELFWWSLRRKPIELFKNSLIGRLGMLVFSEHVMQFNAG